MTLPASVLPQPLPQQDQKREWEMARTLGLEWNPAIVGYDALDVNGNEWELKSTGVNEFAIGRDITLKKIEDCERRYWGFAFYASKTSDRIVELYVCHPDALMTKWKQLKKKMQDSDWYSQTLWKHANADMEKHNLPASLISHFKEELEKILHRGGQTLPNQAISRTMVESSIPQGLGVRIDLSGNIPAQVMEFVKNHAIKRAKQKTNAVTP